VTIVYSVPLPVAIVMIVLALILLPAGIISKVRKTSRQKARNEQLAIGTRRSAEGTTGGTTAQRPGQPDGKPPRPPERPYGM
jgi:hypothetical protein